MAKSLVNTFLEDLTIVLNGFTTNEIKSIIGDSTNNNRTCTVNQVIRFLDSVEQVELATELVAIYDSVIVKDGLVVNRAATNLRTDGFDINELILVLSNNLAVRRNVGRIISAAA